MSFVLCIFSIRYRSHSSSVTYDRLIDVFNFVTTNYLFNWVDLKRIFGLCKQAVAFGRHSYVFCSYLCDYVNYVMSRCFDFEFKSKYFCTRLIGLRITNFMSHQTFMVWYAIKYARAIFVIRILMFIFNYFNHKKLHKC